MRKAPIWVVAVVFISIFSTQISFASVSPGTKCSKLGATATTGGKKYTCVKSGKKLVWNKGVALAKPTPKVTPTAIGDPEGAIGGTPTPTPTPTIDFAQLKLRWVNSDPLVVLPGTLVDSDFNSLQDFGLNSSFTVLVTNDNNVPISGLNMDWATNSSNGKIQVFTEKTDEKGLARIWYFAGVENLQEITVSTTEGNRSLQYQLQLSKPASDQKLFGRPVDVWFSAPRDIYTRVDISARINSNPLSTYYAFANFPNFYTGIQMIDCRLIGTDADGQYSKACAGNRGDYIGHEGHFSVWDWTDPQGNLVHPIIVDEPSTTKCLPFGHEGTGQMCLAAVNWNVGDILTIKVESLPGAPTNFQRLRVTIMSQDLRINQVLAVIDAPGGVNLESFAAFNENWQLNQYTNCGEVETRSFTILDVKFYKNEFGISPTSASAIGNTTSENGILCQNYSFARESGGGIEISSGGLARWANVKDALTAKLEYPGYFFSSEVQAKILWSPISLAGFGK